MHVAYDHQALARQEYGGISRYIVELSTRVSTTVDCSAEVYAPLYVNRYVTPSSLQPRGMRIRRRRGIGRVVLGVNDALSRLNLPRRRDIDVFHETFYSPLNHRPGSAKGLLTVYDMIDEKLSPAQSVDTAKRVAIQRADHVICISEQTRDDLIYLTGIQRERTSVTYLAASPTNGSVPAQRQRPYLLYVGERAGYKNFALFVDAYASSGHLREAADVVAFGGGAFSSSEQERMTAKGLSPSAVVHVSGDDRVLAGLYESALAFVYPSVHEGFGIPPLEAMLRDCPVICSGSSSIPEIVGDAARLFDPGSEADVRSALEAVVESETLRCQLVDKGRSRARMFTWDRCATETIATYRKVLGS